MQHRRGEFMNERVKVRAFLSGYMKSLTFASGYTPYTCVSRRLHHWFVLRCPGRFLVDISLALLGQSVCLRKYSYLFVQRFSQYISFHCSFTEHACLLQH